MSNIHFFYDGIEKIPLDELALRDFLEWMVGEEKQKLTELNFIFCSDEKLLEINKQYLQRDYFTDVISFDLSEGNEIAGEVYISEERIRENAEEMSQSIEKERIRIIFHGLLHLLGYDDKTKGEKERMNEREDHYLAEYVSRGTNRK